MLKLFCTSVLALTAKLSCSIRKDRSPFERLIGCWTWQGGAGGAEKPGTELPELVRLDLLPSLDHRRERDWSLIHRRLAQCAAGDGGTILLKSYAVRLLSEPASWPMRGSPMSGSNGQARTGGGWPAIAFCING